MKKVLLGAVCLALVGLSACALVPSQLGIAAIHSDKEAVAVTDATARKMGKACGFNLLGIVALGDLSIEKAKRNGNIQRVASVDKEVFSFLGLYSSVCVRVTGE